MDKFELSLNPINENNANTINPVSLAYLGDTVYDLYIRTFLVKNKLGNVNVLHTYASSMVNAKAQAIAAEYLLDFLTDEEKAVYRRGKERKIRGRAQKYGSGGLQKSDGHRSSDRVSYMFWADSKGSMN